MSAASRSERREGKDAREGGFLVEPSIFRRAWAVLAAALLVATALSVFTAAPASAKVIEHHKSSLVGVMTYSACLGAQLTIVSGSSHRMMARTDDKSGGYHYKVHWNWQDVTATVDSGSWAGAAYTGELTENTYFDVRAVVNRTYVKTITWTGPGPDVVSKVRTHLTITANGDVTAAGSRSPFRAVAVAA